MGAADVVPGVSGGTVAFITGIYFRLRAIAAIPTAVLHELLRGRIRRFWNRIDGTFLVVLLSGILTSIAAFANLITWAIETYPVAMWSFFFGLILASVWHVLGQLKLQACRRNAAFQQDLCDALTHPYCRPGRTECLGVLLVRRYRNLRYDTAGSVGKFCAAGPWHVRTGTGRGR